jgi:hypothetical protein
VLRVRPPGGPCRRGESEGRLSTIQTDLAGIVGDAAAHLYVWALKNKKRLEGIIACV